jgi:Na+-transporting methylmalonyl-CoA/oxaloacetate decarboxylase gamma subunit
MKKFARTILPAILLLSGISLSAQNLSDLRIGEVLVENTNGLTDSYGQHTGWIEIFNSSYGTVKFAGCYLSDDKDNLQKYHIPASDATTTLPPRQSVIFYASGNSSQGTYHTNFSLKNGSTVYLVSNDGRTIIDTIGIPTDLPADHSVVKVPVGVKMMDMETKVTCKPTPGSYNGDVDAKTNNQIMKEKDPHGWVLTLISVSVVFFALTILAFIFGWIGNANKKAAEPKPAKAVRKGDMSPEVAAAISMALTQEFGTEVYAAIAMALDDYLGGGIHDEESFIITIRPSENSGWNNKTQNFRQSPR